MSEFPATSEDLEANPDMEVDTEEDDDDDDEECFALDDDSYFDFKDSDADEESEVSPDTDENRNRSTSFEMMEEVFPDHSYRATPFTPDDSRVFACAMVSERTMMQKDLPDGIHVKFFENRLDLCTAMIEGPKHTPYADCLFFFDVQVSASYPKSPPKVKFLSYTTQRLNPNLYDNGRVCLSLIGTWEGDPSEKWSAQKSSLLQLFVSIQGLILVAEPFYNEPAYHKKRGKMTKESAAYNGNVLYLTLESMHHQILKPPKCFAKELTEHYCSKGVEICQRLESFLDNASNAPFPLKTSDYGCTRSQLQGFKKAVTELVRKSEETPKSANLS